MNLTVKYTDRHSVPLLVVRVDELHFDDPMEWFMYRLGLERQYSCVINNRMKANEMFVCLNDNEMSEFGKEG